MLLDQPCGDIEATRTLGQFGPAARSAVPALIDVLTGDIGKHRDEIEALKRITQGKPSLLWGVMRDHAPGVRCGLIEVLGSSSESLDGLVGLLHDPSARVRLAAVTALGRIGKPAKKAIPAVQACLDDERPSIRQAARKTLNQLKK
jgi:HEAT repeat protein